MRIENQTVHHWHGSTTEEGWYDDSVYFTLQTAPDGLYYATMTNGTRHFGIDHSRPIAASPEVWRALAVDGRVFQVADSVRVVTIKPEEGLLAVRITWEGDVAFAARLLPKDLLAVLDELDARPPSEPHYVRG